MHNLNQLEGLGNILCRRVVKKQIVFEIGETLHSGPSGSVAQQALLPHRKDSNSLKGAHLTSGGNHCLEMVRLVQEEMGEGGKANLITYRRSSRGKGVTESGDGGAEGEGLALRARRVLAARTRCLSEKSNADGECCNFTKCNGMSVKCEPAWVGGELPNGGGVKGRRASGGSESNGSSATEPLSNPDKMDFSVFLEISPSDRKRFERKKAGRQKLTADWLLISETEQYYTEREEIAKNKHKDDSSSSSGDSTDSSDGEDSVDESSRATRAHPMPSRQLMVSKKKSTDTRVRKNDDRHATMSVKGVKLEGGSPQGEEDPKCRKRMTAAERFLRDNREYYNFPETAERLRKHTAVPTYPLFAFFDSDEEGETKVIKQIKKEAKGREQFDCGVSGTRVTRSSGMNDIVHDAPVISPDSRSKEATYKIEVGGKSNRIDSLCCIESHTAASPTKLTRRKSADIHDEPVNVSPFGRSPQRTEMFKGGVSSAEFPHLRGVSETIGQLYFSFEGIPARESWYMTYQRLIDGIAENEFVYDLEPLQFVLPYQMPKEYLREQIRLRKALLNRKKHELAELVRKSPRCHASTMALFSDILPGRRLCRVNAAALVAASVSNTSRHESDATSEGGASTPRTIDSGSSTSKLEAESTERMAAIAEHIDVVMRLEEQEPLRQERCVTSARGGRGGKRGPLKRKRRKSALMMLNEEIPIDIRFADNPLAQEMDPAFLASIPGKAEMIKFGPDDILASRPGDVVDLWCGCNCGAPSTDDSSTETGSECPSACESDSLDGVGPKPRGVGAGGKRRRLNLTGWPKVQKKKPRLIHPSRLPLMAGPLCSFKGQVPRCTETGLQKDGTGVEVRGLRDLRSSPRNCLSRGSSFSLRFKRR